MKRVVTVTLRHDLDTRNYKSLVEGLADECNSADSNCPAGAFRCPFPDKVCTAITPTDWVMVTDLKEVPDEEA